MPRAATALELQFRPNRQRWGIISVRLALTSLSTERRFCARDQKLLWKRPVQEQRLDPVRWGAGNTHKRPKGVTERSRSKDTATDTVEHQMQENGREESRCDRPPTPLDTATPAHVGSALWLTAPDKTKPATVPATKIAHAPCHTRTPGLGRAPGPKAVGSIFNRTAGAGEPPTRGKHTCQERAAAFSSASRNSSASVRAARRPSIAAASSASVWISRFSNSPSRFCTYDSA